MSQMDSPTRAQTAKAARNTTSTPVSVMTGHLPTISEGLSRVVRETDPHTFPCREHVREGPKVTNRRGQRRDLPVSGPVSGSV
ncbi:hypothetical protein GONAM_10_02620 [Gordonia namibiensis NBRC 108229]|uniref:Uncharacterized protein n=1 Tax=Gordonia namibiensis NBRC 108229 TaxID=1208314 RepID=K6X195_9ACTN|nr:hypothetical protein GONAM_10_02620 [Gordonia namibiensis NBRC 108229]